MTPLADENKCTRHLKRRLSSTIEEGDEMVEEQDAKYARGLELNAIKTSVHQLERQVKNASACIQELRSMVELLAQRRRQAKQP
jgi:hypothetical protein